MKYHRSRTMHVSYVRIGLWRCIHPIRFVRKASFPENLPELDADGETIDFFQGEEFSEKRSMQRSCVTFFNIYFYFYSCKIDYTLSENETNSSLKIWPKISFHKDNQSWGNKNSHPLVYGTRCTDVIDNRRHGRDMEGRFVRCNPPILLRCHASSGTRSIHPAAKLEGAKLPPVNLAA